MLAEHKKNTNIGVGVGLIATAISFPLMGSADTAIIGVIFFLVGGILFLWGCGNYAKAKGYTGFLGILGLLHLLGLIVLVLLPDKHKDGSAHQPLPAASKGNLDELERIGELRDKGVLTEEEFEKKKKELLG